MDSKDLGSLELAGRHLARLLVTLEREAQLLTFDDRSHTCAFNSRHMDEHVRAAVIRLNEAEALGCVEPFNCTSVHNEPFHGDSDNR